MSQASSTGSLSPDEAEKHLSKPELACFLDVRNRDEFLHAHIPGAICVPLESLEQEANRLPKDRLLILNCQSGARSASASALLRSLGFSNVAEIRGGLAAWRHSGRPVQRLGSGIPIFRQVMICVGFFVLIGTLLGIYADRRFLALPLLFGSGLLFAGLSGWCALALLLERMPWNRKQCC